MSNTVSNAREQVNQPQSPSLLSWGGLVTIVVVAAALRFATLGKWSLWIDEAFTLHDAHDVLPSYPLGYLLIRGAVAIAGDSEFALRLLPCLFGIATVAVLALPGASTAATARYRLAALLLALSSWHLFWSQSARHYAPLVFFVVVAARAIPTVTDGKTPARAWRWLVVLCALGLAALCHPSAAFFLPGALLLSWPALHPRARLGLLFFAALGAGLVLRQYGWLFSVHTQYKGGGSTLQLVTSYGFQAGPLLLLAAAVGLWSAMRERQGAVRLGLCFAIVPGGIFLVASVWLFISGYHAIATLPFVMILAARGALSSRGFGRIGWGLVLIAEQVVGLVMYHDSNGMRPQYRQAAVEISRDANAVVYATQDAPLAYYLGEGRRQLRYSAAVHFLDDYMLDDLTDAIGGSNVVWALVHMDDLHDWSPEALVRLDRLAERATVLELAGSFGPKTLSLVLYRFP